MHAIFDIVLPVFAIMGAGYLCGRLGVLGQGSSQALNGFVFFVSLPALFLVSLSRVPLVEALNGPFLLAYCLGMAAIFAAILLLGHIFSGRPLSVLGLQGMSAIFANTGYMGIPLLFIAFQDEARLPAIVATIVNGALVMGLVTVVIEIDQHKEKGFLGALAKVGGALIRNPLVVSAALGLLLSALEWQLPKPVQTFCDLLGATAGPCALFAIGLFMVGKPLFAGLGESLWLSAIKLIVQPALAAYLAYKVFTLPPVWAASAVILSALPTGTLTFVLSSRYEIHQERTTATILVSTLLSVVTLSLLFVWLDLN